MSKGADSSKFRDFTRGGQTTIHGIRMFFQVLRHGIWISCWVFALSFTGLFFSKTTSFNRYAVFKGVEAEIRYTFYRNSSINIGKQMIATKAFLKSPELAKERLIMGQVITEDILYASLIITGFGFVGFMGYMLWRGKKQAENKPVKGRSIVLPKELKRMVHGSGNASEYSLSGVPLLKDTEVQHLLLAGTTGSGKTVAIKELMDQVRAKGQRAIVYDIDGTFIPNYYREGKDILLNPLDIRMPSWNIWQECSDMADFDTAALSMMPEHLSGSDPFWIRSAHTIFACAAMALSKREVKPTTKSLLGPMFDDDLQKLSDLVNGTPAASLVSDKIEKTALSIKATLSTYCKSLLYLKEEEKDELFSVRRWIEEDEGDSWLFISCNTQKIGALKPLLSVWLDVAAKSVLSLNPSYERRLWFFLDELPSLHKLPSLMDALSRGRKYGACFVAALQDIHQLDTVYGRDEAKSLSSLFNTKLFYRTQEPTSAAWMSKNMGEVELLEKREGFSYGANEIRDGVSINQERRKEAVVNPSDFLVLKDLEAYLKLPGDWPVAKLKFNYKDRPLIADVFKERAIEESSTSVVSPKKPVAADNTNTKSESGDIDMEKKQLKCVREVERD